MPVEIISVIIKIENATVTIIVLLESFLKDKMGEQIFSEDITICDDPHRPRGLRSKPFDGEGVTNKKRELVTNGILSSWVLDLRSSRQLGLETTGHASRGSGSPPSPSATNVYLEPG